MGRIDVQRTCPCIVFYPPVLTPPLAVISVWRSTVRQAKKITIIFKFCLCAYTASYFSFLQCPLLPWATDSIAENVTSGQIDKKYDLVLVNGLSNRHEWSDDFLETCLEIMQTFQIFFIAAGLAADSFAVSVSSGAIIEKLRLRHAMRIAVFFGFFQGIMPWIGWKMGNLAGSMIRAIDHWLAFIILFLIGSKMIYEACKIEEEIEKTIDPLNVYILFTLAIATSIDALAVGVTFSFLDISIIEPVIIIGLVTFFFSLAGTYIGGYFGHFFEDKIELVGGLILIGIGTKILIEHIFF